MEKRRLFFFASKHEQWTIGWWIVKSDMDYCQEVWHRVNKFSHWCMLDGIYCWADQWWETPHSIDASECQNAMLIWSAGWVCIHSFKCLPSQSISWRFTHNKPSTSPSQSSKPSPLLSPSPSNASSGTHLVDDNVFGLGTQVPTWPRTPSGTPMNHHQCASKHHTGSSSLSPTRWTTSSLNLIAMDAFGGFLSLECFSEIDDGAIK
jgi:hypothetical protein